MMTQISTVHGLLNQVIFDATHYQSVPLSQDELITRALSFVPQPADRATVAEVFEFGQLMAIWGRDSNEMPLRSRALADKLMMHISRAVWLAKILAPERKL
jgi:hypothetical protein